MQSQAGTRKRPAPGTSPPMQQHNLSTNQSGLDLQDLGDVSQMPDDQFLSWGNPISGDGMTDTFDPTTFSTDFSMPSQTNTALPNGVASNQLVRRNTNQQLARARGFTPITQNNELWPDYNNNGGQAWQQDEDDEELDRRAAEAKRDAQSKRPAKQIPPFIQKLSSFLDNNNNTDLIRWSQDGNSFVVLDEDEFAKTLIPELFKHKNYASFVRQLNMYGFHKKVGLSDNSMRASEKRAKSPSEYYNPYFKRGRPELLWLIQKPKSEPPNMKKKGTKQEDGGDADEPAVEERAAARVAGPSGSMDLVSLPRTQWQALQREIDQLKRSQQQINSMIARFQHENTNYVRQASVQHERHENSINAILTFLATFYHRNLDGQGPGMFPGAIPNNQPQTGNVYDMGEFEDSSATPQAQLQRLQKKPLAILPPPSWDAAESGTAGSASPANSSINKPAQQRGGLQVPQQQQSQRASPASRTSNSPLPKRESSGTPNVPNQFPDTGGKARHVSTPSNDDILNAINNVNANTDVNSHNIDFSSALRQYENANGNAPLTPEQRDNMLHMMASSSGTNTPNQLISKAGNASKSKSNLGAPSIPQTNETDGALDSDLLEQFKTNRDQLDMLQRLQQEQDSKVQALADRLQPLSPSGSIPGLNMPSSQPGSTYGGNPGDFDINSFINSDYFPDFDATSNGGANGATGDFDFGDSTNTNDNQDQDQDGDDLFGDGGEDDSTQALDEESPAFAGGRIVGSVASSSGAPTPANHVDVEDDGEGGADGSARKRRRRN
ncbi:hypothetical protein FH972_026072 [Carpinus fangiana]|uniref:HSF-type DNA-binding domain-containing protein n=1 Tax=Carpinus fangiana TaxID=176857 RepID=A0A5N6L2V6_9ROSI|nr:hypothetical protein FH972_026072 [Carpinus fangiana]